MNKEHQSKVLEEMEEIREKLAFYLHVCVHLINQEGEYVAFDNLPDEQKINYKAVANEILENLEYAKLLEMRHLCNSLVTNNPHYDSNVLLAFIDLFYELSGQRKYKGDSANE